MILLPREMVGQFLSFVETAYGTEVIHQSQPSDELARFFCQNKFFVVRNISEDENGTSPTVEVWCNDLEKLKDVEARWEATLKIAFEEYDAMFELEDDLDGQGLKDEATEERNID